jgi:3-oxoacyl-[acyl-carrier protein] reductase
MAHATARIVLITGASRGIGADVARQLAGPDTHVIVNCRTASAEAHRVAADIRRAGGQASVLAADICDPAATASMFGTIAARFGRLDAVILNAAATHFNRDAQKRLATSALPLMPSGSRLVYVTSHQAHFFPHKAVPKGYGSVAASKRAGETTLQAMRPVFEHAGVTFTVASGDIADGPVEGFAPAIAGAATTGYAPSVVYVGDHDYLMTTA